MNRNSPNQINRTLASDDESDYTPNSTQQNSTNYFASHPFASESERQGSPAILNTESLGQVRYAPSYMENEMQCDLCINEYDLMKYVPMMLCENQHNCCLQCVKEIVVRKKQCPFCRKSIKIEQIKKNRIVSQMVSSEAKRKGVTLQVNSNPEKQIIQKSPPKKNDHGSIIVEDMFPNINEQQNALVDSLLNPDNLPDRPEPTSCGARFCQRLTLESDVYPVAMFFVMFYNLPFFIVELYYAFTLPEQNCMDVDYGVGSSLRDWLFVSGWTGLGMFASMVVFVFIWKMICYKKCQIVSKTVAVVNIVGFFLKFLGINIWGFVVNGNISDQDAEDCDSGVSAYMEALLIIEVVIVCGLGSKGR